MGVCWTISEAAKNSWSLVVTMSHQKLGFCVKAFSGHTDTIWITYKWEWFSICILKNQSGEVWSISIKNTTECIGNRRHLLSNMLCQSQFLCIQNWALMRSQKTKQKHTQKDFQILTKLSNFLAPETADLQRNTLTTWAHLMSSIVKALHDFAVSRTSLLAISLQPSITACNIMDELLFSPPSLHSPFLPKMPHQGLSQCEPVRN